MSILIFRGIEKQASYIRSHFSIPFFLIIMYGETHFKIPKIPANAWNITRTRESFFT